MIDADDPIVGELLASTLGLVLEVGGRVHPAITLVARTGQLHVECNVEEGLLVSIPKAAFIRVDRFTFGSDDGRITIDAVPEDATDTELELAFTTVALHNQCGKLAWMRATHPSLAVELAPEVITAVRAIIPSFRDHEYDLVEIFWSNRCFKVDLGDGPERVLVPIVDLLNHHTEGATGNWENNDFSVDVRRPFGTSECALDYGMDRDALQFAVIYGFLDASNMRNTVAHAQLDDVIAASGDSPAERLLASAAERQRTNPFG